MHRVKRLVLDVLKPHTPNVLDFSRHLAEHGSHRVKTCVVEMDDKTETLQLVIEGEDIDFEGIQQVISENGASLHSIDEVEIEGSETEADTDSD
ncbi:MAG: DUF211 domain-containing protein [Candidatus Thiodiazotropha taylori]|nr:DUF211 domain-containing protein [Candidatus Thiodiazotropha taylori]